VEHPELVRQRILRGTNLVGRENVVAAPIVASAPWRVRPRFIRALRGPSSMRSSRARAVQVNRCGTAKWQSTKEQPADPASANPDEALRPPRVTLSAAAASDEIGDAVVRLKLALEHFEVVGGAVVALPKAAVGRHVQSSSDGAADRADRRRWPRWLVKQAGRTLSTDRIGIQ
jgi:hypothetical protein